MTDDALLAFHRLLVATPSVSGDEGAAAAKAGEALRARGVEPVRVGDSVWAVTGRAGPVLVLDSHLDTVPPSPGWTMAPWTPLVIDGRVHGLGSNDAKACVAGMMAAFLRIHAAGGLPGARLVLALAAGEETSGHGSAELRAALDGAGLHPAAAVIGEPTGLDVSVSQKGLLILELRAKGQSCHAAHGRALGVTNALRQLARDLVALDAADLGPEDPGLGPVTLEPTEVRGGIARNVIPGEATCVLDVRTNPSRTHEALVARLRGVVRSELAVLSDRLVPCAVDPADPLVAAALAARPGAKAFASRGVSDWVWFRDVPAVKAGPGRTERSHTADEFVLESEVRDGARFYEALARGWAAGLAGRGRAP